MDGVKLLTDDDVRARLPMHEALAVSAEAFRELAQGQATVPHRLVLPIRDQGATLFKPAHIDSGSVGALGLKIVSVRPGNSARGLPTVCGVMVMLHQETGVPIGILDATYLTVLRTAASSGVATDALARANASSLLVFGAGEQGRAHVHAIACVRQLRRITIWNRTASRAVDLVESLKREPYIRHDCEIVVCATLDEANVIAATSDIIVLATNATDVLLRKNSVAPGTHINAIGSYTSSMKEFDGEIIGRARTFSDCPLEELWTTTGEYAGALISGIKKEDCFVSHIGDVLIEKCVGRATPEDVTIYKSVGNAVQDVAAARAVLNV